MKLKELAALTGLSPNTITVYISRGLIPPPHGPKNRYATYGLEHLEAIRAYQALKHNNTTLRELGAFLREEGISLVEYAKRREDAIREHGLGVA